ncbi:MAG: IclR family transcriptional regulator [Xanthobacteraceae bacterium]|nr:IclR family transcriptional regulator [Xanthobacteraceae bacterium]
MAPPKSSAPRARDKARPMQRGRMQLISRAAAVLRALEAQSGYASLGQIANASGLPRPTVQRIVDALAAEQFVSVDPQRGVRLGPELTRIARAAYVDLAAIVQPHIDNLARETGETAAVTVLRDRAAVYIAQAVPDRTIVLASRVGAPIPLHSTANGKALLAGLAEGLVRSLLGTELTRSTRNTITSVKELLAELAEVERQGFAYDEEEQTEGVCAIAMPFRDVTGTTCSLSVVAPSPRFKANLARFRAALARCRDAIELATGMADNGRREPRRTAQARLTA